MATYTVIGLLGNGDQTVRSNLDDGEAVSRAIESTKRTERHLGRTLRGFIVVETSESKGTEVVRMNADGQILNVE